MVNPGYPMQPNPMMGGPQPPMQMPPMQRPMRRGTSKAVPVVVSAGLAVGVFCGLLFGLGTGKDDAHAGPAKGDNLKHTTADEGTTPGAAPAGTGATAALPAPPKQGSGAGSAVVAAAGSGSAAAAGAGSATVPSVTVHKLTVKIGPDDTAAQAAKIVVDGKTITGNTVELPLDSKSVKVSITAPGYHSEDKTIDIAGDETTFQIDLRKRGGGPGSPGFGGASHTGPSVPTRPPGPPPPPKKKPGGDLIDI